MTPFPRPLASMAVPIVIDNVDTDTIIPSREMRTTGRTGLAEGMFAPWRYLDAEERTPDPDFSLNKPKAAGAQVILGGSNFGCGSSREHAVWALAEFGIRCVIAPSFAPIFRNNCIRNGILPLVLERETIEQLAWQELHVDLAAQTVTFDAASHAFEIDSEEKQMLAKGLDVIDLTLHHREEIEQWLAQDRAARPHIYLEDAK